MNDTAVSVRMLGPSDAVVLVNVAEGVFDYAVKPELAREFLDDPRHHLAVAIEGDLVVGVASAFHYVHPDKPAQLFINEVGVAPTHQRQGIGRRLVAELLDRAKELGCTEAWVATELDNEPARRAFAAAGGIEDPAKCTVFTFQFVRR